VLLGVVTELENQINVFRSCRHEHVDITIDVDVGVDGGGGGGGGGGDDTPR
jgi:hypothetical protein